MPFRISGRSSTGGRSPRSWREADRADCAAILKEALAAGRAEIARRLAEKPYAGMEAAAAYAFLTDQILRLAHDFVTARLHPLANPTTSERLLLMAVGGYGRGEMALHSDVDIAFVTPVEADRLDRDGGRGDPLSALGSGPQGRPFARAASTS